MADESDDKVDKPTTESREESKESPKTTGADVPEKAQPLPPEAGSVDPAAEIEAKTKATLPAGEKPKTEAKAEEALPGVEKPSKTPTIEGASEKGEPVTPEKVAATPPKEGAASVKPAPPRAPAGENPPGKRPSGKKPQARRPLPRKRLRQPVTSLRLRLRRGRLLQSR